jgi:hypothetical protein
MFVNWKHYQNDRVSLHIYGLLRESEGQSSLHILIFETLWVSQVGHIQRKPIPLNQFHKTRNYGLIKKCFKGGYTQSHDMTVMQLLFLATLVWSPFVILQWHFLMKPLFPVLWNWFPLYVTGLTRPKNWDTYQLCCNNAIDVAMYGSMK